MHVWLRGGEEKNGGAYKFSFIPFQNTISPNWRENWNEKCGKYLDKIVPTSFNVSSFFFFFFFSSFDFSSVCIWVFTVKYKANETIDRFKAKLVAKGYTQTYGIDYMETFAPLAKFNTIRILISLAMNLDRSLHQFNVKNACLVERRGREKW